VKTTTSPLSILQSAPVSSYLLASTVTRGKERNIEISLFLVLTANGQRSSGCIRRHQTLHKTKDAPDTKHHPVVFVLFEIALGFHFQLSLDNKGGTHHDSKSCRCKVTNSSHTPKTTGPTNPTPFLGYKSVSGTFYCKVVKSTMPTAQCTPALSRNQLTARLSMRVEELLATNSLHLAKGSPPCICILGL
jgi:hypothetical protein